MKRLLAALLLVAAPAFAQANGWQEIQNGWGEIQTPPWTYATLAPPPGCASGYVPYFDASLKLVCSPTVYAPATDTTTATGTIAARNLTATALATPVITPPVSNVLSLFTTVTVVAGASLADGDFFTLSDGSAVVYEFDNDATVTPGRVGITFVGDETAQAIRDLVVVAVNGSTLEATAIAAAADTLTVTSDTAGDTMGVNSENVANAGFLVPVWGEPTHATTYGYKVEACLADGKCAPSAEVQTAAGHAELSNRNYNSVTWGAVTGASYYKLTRVTGTPSGGDAPPRLLYTGPLLTFSDTNATSTSEAVATGNETGRVTTDGFTMATGAASTYVLTSDANGVGTWQVPSGVSGLTAGRVTLSTGATSVGDDAGLLYDAATDTLTLVGGLRGSLKAGANVAADTITHIGSLGTGTGAAGTIIFQTGVPQASGATQHVPATALTLTNAGTGGTSAPQALFAAGTGPLPGIASVTYPTSGIFWNEATTMRFAVGGVQQMVIGTNASFLLTSDAAAIALGSATDTRLSRGGAPATLQQGAAASATPVAQTFAAQGARGGTDTNVAGQPRVYRGSLGTGTADPGALIDRTGYPTTSGTTQHAESSRRYVSGHWTALTAGAATGFATLTYGASTSIGAEFFVTVRAGDGTNRQGMSYRVAVNSVRDAAGDTQSVVAVIGTPPVAAGSGTLTCTFDAAEGASAATLRANCASSLTETFLDANFQVIANGPGLTVGTL